MYLASAAEHVRINKAISWYIEQVNEYVAKVTSIEGNQPEGFQFIADEVEKYITSRIFQK